MSEVSIAAAVEGDGHYRTKSHDWLLLCPHLGASEKIALQVLCGLVRDGHQRNLTMAEIGQMLIKGPVDVDEAAKPMSMSGVAKILNRLSELGQITDPLGDPIRVSNRLVSVLRLKAYRLPRHRCSASRNVYDALARIRGEEAQWDYAVEGVEPVPATPRGDAHNSVPNAHFSVPDAHNSVRNAQKSVQDKPLTSENGAFLRSSSVSSSSSSVVRAGAREDATPEAPLEDEEEMKSYDEDPSPGARAHYEGESEEGTAENGPDGLQEGLEGVRRFIASLPGLEGAQEGAYGFLEYPVAEALAAGWTEQALKATLIRHTDVRQARNPGVIPSWYANAFSKIGEAPKPVVPLCAHPGHARNPVSDPVNGGCLPCNTVLRQAPAVPVRRERIEPVSSDDVVSAADLIRQAMRNRKFDAREPSRRQMPGHRAKDQADQARRQAGELLRGE